jgi:conjugal transfer pilus assembly protein TraF
MAGFKVLPVLLLGMAACLAKQDVFSSEGRHFGQSWYGAPERGWLWYKRVVPQRSPQRFKERRADIPQAPQNQALQDSDFQKSYPYSVQMEKIRKTFDELQAKAILEPTLENVQRMQNAQNIIINRSTAFEKVWMLASLVSAGNYRESDQPSPMHRKISQEQSERHLDRQIRHYAKTFGLFFIFKKGCPWCEEFAPIVKRFVETFGFEVKAISPDGEPLALFPDAISDNGTISQINPEGIFPCLFLVNPRSRQVIPLSRGLVSFSDLRENFNVIIQSLPDASVPSALVPNAFVPNEFEAEASEGRRHHVP